MKKKIRCYFTDFWNGFNYEYTFRFLFSEYEFLLDEKNPDYLFYSCNGNNHLDYNDCIKIFWSAENVIPDLNLCDYAVGSFDLQSGDRTLREFIYLAEINNRYIPELDTEQLLHRKFCNFVYTNNTCADPMRERFFKALSNYKRIDAGGGFSNNMGKRVVNKRAFLKEYKFTLAIENSSFTGYTTEKICDPFMSQSLPIYWGNPHISLDYNPNSFVNIMDYSSVEEAVEEVIRLDNDDDAYLEKMTAPFWLYGNSFEEFYAARVERMLAFFRNIFEQPLEKARRRTRYGNAELYYLTMKRYSLSPERLLKEKYMNLLRRVIKRLR